MNNSSIKYVYFTQENDNGPIKIGSSCNAQTRKNGLQTGNPRPLNIISTVEGTIQEEKKIHKIFDKYRLQPSNEWFEPSDEIIAFANFFNEKKLAGALKNGTDDNCTEKFTYNTDDPKENEIYRTKDYEKFIISPKRNRPVNWAYVKQLAGSIQSKNLLHLVPITVDKNFEIVDGQHRKEAAQMLNFWLYYMMCNLPVSKDDIVRLNNVRRDWKFDDYLNAYIEQGFIDYYFLREYKKKFNKLTPSNILLILFGKSDYGKIHNIFKKGEFIFDFDNQSHFDNVGRILEDFITSLKEINHPYKNQVSYKYFVATIAQLEQVDGFNHEKCIKTIKARPANFYLCNTKKDYIFMMEKLQNYKVRTGKQIIFR